MPKDLITPKENIPKIEEIRYLESEEKITEQKRKIREDKYQFTTNWFEPHVPSWEKTLYPLKDKPINVLEIGVFEGRSSTWLLEELFNHSESKLVVIDLFKQFWGANNDYDHEKTFRENIAKSGKEKQVQIIKSNSFDALVKLNHENQTKFDFIYIDGSHFSCDVMSDAVLSWNMLKEGGIMIFDDYEWDYYEEEYNNPRIAVDDFLECYQTQIEIIYKRYQVAIKKVIKENIATEREDKKLV